MTVVNDEAELLGYRTVAYILEVGNRVNDSNQGNGRTFECAGLSLYALHSGGNWRHAERLTLAGDGWTAQWRRKVYGYGGFPGLKLKVYGSVKAFEDAMLFLKLADFFQ